MQNRQEQKDTMLIVNALKNKDINQLRQAIKQYNWSPTDHNHNITVILDFCLMYMNLSIYHEYDIEKHLTEKRLFAEYSKNQVLTVDLVFNYFITRFLKIRQDNIQYDDEAIKSFVSMIQLLENLNCYFISKPQIIKFTKEIIPYIAKTPYAVNYLDFLQTASADEIIKQLDADILAYLNKDVMEQAQISNQDLINTAYYLTAYITINLYNCKELNDEFKNRLLNEYRDCKLHYYQRNHVEFKFEINEAIDQVVKYLMDILMRSFQLNTSSLIVTNIVNSINIVSSQTNNKLVIILTNKIQSELEKFFEIYIKANELTNEYNKALPVCHDISNLLYWDKKLRECINDIVPLKCIDLIEFVQQVMLLTNYILLLSANKSGNSNTKKYKDVIVENYRISTSEIYILFNANIYFHEIEFYCKKYYEAIQSDILNITPRKNAKYAKRTITVNELHESLFNNIRGYLSRAYSIEFGLQMPELAYDYGKSLSENIKRFIYTINDITIKDTLNELQIESFEKKKIHYFLIMEQLLNTNELKLILSNDYQSIRVELLKAKLIATKYLIKINLQKDTKHDTEKDLSVFYRYGHYHLTNICELIDYKDISKDDVLLEVIKKDHVLLEVIKFMISPSYNYMQPNNIANYIEMGLKLFPKQIEILQQKAAIENEVIASEIEKVKKIANKEDEKKQLILIKAADCKFLELPISTKKMRGNDLYTEIKSIHESLSTKYNNVLNISNSIKLYDIQYQELLTNLNEFKVTITTCNDINLIKANLQTHSQYRDKLMILVNKMKLACQEASKKIDEYINFQNKFLDLQQQYKLLNSNVEKAEQQKNASTKIRNEQKRTAKKLKSAQKIAYKKQLELDDTDQLNENINPEPPLMIANVTIPSQVDAVQLELEKVNAPQIIADSVHNLSDSVQHEHEHEHEKVDPDRNSALLKVSNNSITSSISAFDTLHKLDEALRKINSNLIFKGSLVTRFCIHKFNPLLAKRFSVNDIDVLIPFHSNVNIKDIIETLNQQFNFKLIKSNQYYKQYLLEVDNIGIELTLPLSVHYCSNDFLISSMGKMVFSTIRNKQEADASDKMIVQADTHFLEVLPPDNYKKEFENAIKLSEFSMLSPVGGVFSKYCIRIYKFSVKCNSIGLMNRFDKEPKNSAKTKDSPTRTIILYHELFNTISQFIYRESSIQKNKTFFYELSDFINYKEAINIKLAQPLISGIYAGFILSKLKNEVTTAVLRELSDKCASQFFLQLNTLKNTSNLQSDLEKIAYDVIKAYLQSLKRAQKSETPYLSNYSGKIFQPYTENNLARQANNNPKQQPTNRR